MAILRTSSFSGALCAALLTACSGGSSNVAGTTGSGGGGTGGGGTGGTGTTSTAFMPAAHAALPQVVTLGGPVLKTPKVQPIMYADDPAKTEIESFLQELTTSPFWSATTSEYKVGPLTVLPTIVLPAPAPATLTDDQMNAALTANLTGASPAWGAADPSTIYLFLAPPQTIVSDPGGTGCQDYDGYHLEASVGTVNVPYAVGCACPGFDGKGVTDLQERTVAISHELVEAATDPFPNVNPAYAQEDNADVVWTFMSGGEVADMCEFNTDSYVVPPGSKYMIQRSWSNKAAKAGTNPCVPVVTPDPYFNSAAVLPDMLAISGGGPTLMTPGVKIPVGGTKVIDVNLFSDAPTSGPWKVSALDGNKFTTGTANLQLTLDKSTGVNGDTLHLTIKVLKGDPQLKAEPFVLFSDLNGQENMWMGFVGQ